MLSGLPQPKILLTLVKINRTYAVGYFCRAKGPAKITKTIEALSQLRKS